MCTFFDEETVEELVEPKREHVLYFLDGNGENWLVEFLDSLTRNSTSKTMCFACRVPRSCVRGLSVAIWLHLMKVQHLATHMVDD